MIFRFACILGGRVDDFTIFAVVRYQDTDGVFIDRYCKKGKCKMTSVYMTYPEFSRYYSYGLWTFN